MTEPKMSTIGIEGDAVEQVDKAHQGGVHPAAKVPGDAADNDADENFDKNDHKTDQQ